MREVVIIDAIRTPIGKLGGTLKHETANQLGAHILRALLARTHIDAASIDEIIIGQAKQSADESNVARVMSLQAGIPHEVPAYTVHRQCGSGIQAIHNAAQQIALGLSDIIIAGGVESMSTAPYYLRQARYGYHVGNAQLLDPNVASQPGSQPAFYEVETMGQTAETLAKKYRISRERQDAFAYESQLRAKRAIEAGYFDAQIIPYTVKHWNEETLFATDEHPRLTPLPQMATFPPVFQEGGSVTAANCSGRNDGASVLLMMSRDKAEALHIQPKVRIVAQAAAGVDPREMGIGPVPAVQKVLKQANLSIDDIDIVELNEAFAAQALAVMEELQLDHEKVNPVGGAIALGHPIGATGAIIMTKLMHELVRTNKRYGIATVCIAGGLGVATLVENIACS